MRNFSFEKAFSLLALLLVFTSPSFAEESLISRRQRLDAAARSNPFVISTHRANFFLPFTYMSKPNEEPFEGTDEASLQHLEIEYQISVKVNIARGVFQGYGDLDFGYTQLAFWQAYHREISAPFRSIDHEPEVFVTFAADREFAGMAVKIFRVGISHQSNGNTETRSRSWNRLSGEAIMERGHFYLSVKPWLRIFDIEEDDNPDIYKYMGYGEINGLYQWGRHQFGFMFRNNLRRENKGAWQIDWSVPIQRKISFFTRYFDGYGESLIDYNHHNRRISVGFLLSNWL